MKYSRHSKDCVCAGWEGEQLRGPMHHFYCRVRKDKKIIGLTPIQAFDKFGPP